MQKKVAFAPWRSSRSRTRGVSSGAGPSSKVRLIIPRAALCAGSRVRLSPSHRLRGRNTPAVTKKKLAAIAAAAHGQSEGRQATAAQAAAIASTASPRSEEHTSELQSLAYLVCRL